MGWFKTRELEPGVFVTLEPAVDPMFRASIVTVLGRDRDLQLDFGCGVLPLRPALPLSGKPVVAVAAASTNFPKGWATRPKRRDLPDSRVSKPSPTSFSAGRMS